MKKNNTIYIFSTGLLTLLVLFSAGNYFFNNTTVIEAFISLGYPTHIIYPLAAVKIIGLIVLWAKQSRSLTEWAYAGFFFNMILAFFAHIMVGDGEFIAALIGLILVLVSYITYKNFK